MKTSLPIELEKPSTEGEFMSGEEVETIKRMLGGGLGHAMRTDERGVYALAKRLGVELD